MEFFLLPFGWFLFSIVAYFMAKHRNRSGFLWFFATWFIGFFSLILLAFLGNNKALQRRCPFCQEWISNKAIKCPHCQSEIVLEQAA